MIWIGALGVSLRVGPWEELAAGRKRGPGQPLESGCGLGEPLVCVCVCAWMSVLAARVGLWSWVLKCPSASNWADWDPEATTGQIKYLSPGAGELHICEH